MIKTILMPVLVGTLVLCARAGSTSIVTGRMVESKQDFQGYFPDQENIHRETEPGVGGYYWHSPADVTLVTTTVLWDDDSDDNKYLSIDASERPTEGVTRLFAPHNSASGAVTNACTSIEGAGGYDGFYSSFRTKFALYDNGEDDRPENDGQDRLVLWAKKDASNSESNGVLYVTAGCYDNAFRNVTVRDFVITTTNIDPSAWHDVTLRVIPSVMTGSHALGFLIWIDGRPAVAEADGYQVLGSGCDMTDLLPEVRLLIAERRLFPAMTAPGDNGSVAMSGVTFTGIGSVDDFNFSTNAPAEWAKSSRLFSLNWDIGVTGVAYCVGASSVTNFVPSADIGRRNAVFTIPSAETDVAVMAYYNAAEHYSQGAWRAAGACSLVTNVAGTVTNYAFRCDASANVAEGYIRSYRPEVGLGGSICFNDAKELAKGGKGVTIVLTADFAASRYTADEGMIEIQKDETVTIDLHGHSITNAIDEFPTIRNYGKLTIFDSVGGGRVVPYRPFAGNTNDCKETAIHNYASIKAIPELTIKGGIYDGWIDNSGGVTNRNPQVRANGKFNIVRSGYDNTEPQFISLGGDEFDYADYLEDPTLCYIYDEPYWKPFTNAYVWCGKGEDDLWSNTNNWRCQMVPKSGDYAIFPAKGTNVWEADLGTGIAVRDIWFVGDVILHGSADLSDVKWTTPADGRIRGDATLKWTGKLPPDLSTLLDDRWAGVVAVSEVGHKSPKLLSDLGSWGTSKSKVRFTGVRGYYHRSSNLTVPYALELVNGENGYGWKNDAGFTGGVITFPSLSGSGDFVSPKNTIANRQIIIFREVMSYQGILDVQGKRVVLGPGDAETLEAGSITWSTGLKIRSGYVHNCRVAAFGGTMDVAGDYNDELANYTGSTVGDTAMVVNLMPGSITAELCVTNPVGVVKVVRWSDDATIIDGRRVVTNQLLTANSLTSITAPASASAALSSMSFKNYYTPKLVTSGKMLSVQLSLNTNAVPVIGSSGGESANITFTDDGMVSVIVSNVIEGFWYGLEYNETLNSNTWMAPEIWTVAEPGRSSAELSAPVQGASGFYRVVVSDVNPNGATDE